MITKDQIAVLAKKYKINQMVIFREYLQVLFLDRLYSHPLSKDVYFKGGTALHLIYKEPRFSEDLDFTANLSEKNFQTLTSAVFGQLQKIENASFKERKTITGKKFLLTAAPSVLPYKTFVSLDFSFREKVISPQKSIIETDYPVLFRSYVYHLGREEIFAEKIRAILTRQKGRDIYDLWFLLNQGVLARNRLIKEKLKYYHLEKIASEQIIKRIEKFSEKDFVLDLRPFVPFEERERLSTFFFFVKDYLKRKLPEL